MPVIPLSRAVSAINKAGALLVYPIKDKPEIPSLWSTFYPKDKMSWDWSEDGDDRVAELWHLRTELATSGKVAYLKWIKDRATLFSLDLFTALLSIVSARRYEDLKLSPEAITLLQTLNEDSPVGTKDLKSQTLIGGPLFERATKELWRRLLIVGYGETDEGGYPSLLIGSTKLLFEDCWDNSRKLTAAQSADTISKYLPAKSPVYSQYARLAKHLL